MHQTITKWKEEKRTEVINWFMSKGKKPMIEECADYFLSQLPSLITLLEEQIGPAVQKGFDLNAMSRGGSPHTIETVNKECQRIRTLLSEAKQSLT